MVGSFQTLDELMKCLVFYYRTSRREWHRTEVDLYHISCNVLRKFDMDGSRLLRLCSLDRMVDQVWHMTSIDHTDSKFGDRLHRPYHIDDLKLSLLRLSDRFLTRDEEHWKPS